MPAQEYPILQIEAEIEGAQRTGRFEMRKAEVQGGIRTGPLVDNGFSQALAAISEIIGEQQLDGITVNNGAGQRYWELDVEIRDDGDDGQWGYTADESVLDSGSATAGDRYQKKQVLLNYLEKGEPDSMTPARLIYGGYAPDGIMPEDYVNVYIEDPQGSVDRDKSSTVPMSLTCIRTLDLSEAVSATERTG
ncbi:hypothetical protein [Haloarcula sp. CBA1122]|uniref:hypothetical protein n=1 Tax=Haloarcula sp. CBA1122 TaxID=2668069 RepID=UPI00130CAC09|nr:hypothetical protein [Haloarcula sp. CBA1122]MUV50981.1 hypothetical protein [Haloarcula sp. CBA1122]